MKYKVRLRIELVNYYEREIEADDEDDAREQADELLLDGDPSQDDLQGWTALMESRADTEIEDVTPLKERE